jgi:serine/threonine-protein kinase
MVDQGGNDSSGGSDTLLGEPRKTLRVDPLIGQVLDGRYRVDAVLGEGGMGIVYKAMHTSLGKPLAIKVLRPEVSKNEEIVARFRQEAQSASQIGNQHIIDISDFGVLPDGSTYFVMEFLGGRSLTGALEAEPFTVERTLHVAQQLCRALGAAHEHGIVHRDMKPDNVQLVQRGADKDFVKVLDFGIAKVGGSTSKLTQAGQVFGTPHYMSPEQCAGTAVDHRTDIYAVGIMLYELATGKVPFDADNLMGILTKHLYENPIPPHELPPPVNVPSALEAVIMQCLAKKPEQRYASMSDLLADLDAIKAGLTPQAVVDQVARNTHASNTASDLDAPGRMTVGLGQPEVPGRKGILPMAIGGIILLGGIIAFSMFGGRSAEPQHVVKPARDPQVQNSAPQVPAPPSPTQAAPAPPTDVAPAPPVVVSSDPARVEVYRDGVLLGNTPFSLPRPVGTEQVQLDLRLSGYEAKAVAITAASSESLAVTLMRVPATRHTGPSRPAPTEPKTDKPKPEKPRHGAQSEVLDPWD